MDAATVDCTPKSLKSGCSLKTSEAPGTPDCQVAEIYCFDHDASRSPTANPVARWVDAQYTLRG